MLGQDGQAEGASSGDGPDQLSPPQPTGSVVCTLVQRQPPGSFHHVMMAALYLLTDGLRMPVRMMMARFITYSGMVARGSHRRDDSGSAAKRRVRALAGRPMAPSGEMIPDQLQNHESMPWQGGLWLCQES